MTMLFATLLRLPPGPVFDFSDTWQPTMNTVASQLTFLVAFQLHNTQNRDARALQLTLDDLLRGGERARRDPIDLESPRRRLAAHPPAPPRRAGDRPR